MGSIDKEFIDIYNNEVSNFCNHFACDPACIKATDKYFLRVIASIEYKLLLNNIN